MVSRPPWLMALLSFSLRDHAVTEKAVLGGKKKERNKSSSESLVTIYPNYSLHCNIFITHKALEQEVCNNKIAYLLEQFQLICIPLKPLEVYIWHYVQIFTWQYHMKFWRLAWGQRRNKDSKSEMLEQCGIYSRQQPPLNGSNSFFWCLCWWKCTI